MAGIITAVTGLIVALHQIGIFGGEEQKVPQVQKDAIKPPKLKESPVAPPPGTPKPSATSPMAPYPVTLSAGTEVRVGDLVYRVLAARLDRYAPN
ncbi:MAG TPA: hypothetical protein VEH53_00945, partial [archaeon]|nr:hypothetical protein [archaeon]